MNEYLDYEDEVKKIIWNHFHRKFIENEEISDLIFEYCKDAVDEYECAKIVVEEMDRLAESSEELYLDGEDASEELDELNF